MIRRFIQWLRSSMDLTVRPAAGVNLPCSPVGRYFEAREEVLYVITFELLFEPVVAQLRKEGWTIQVEAFVTGELFYVVYKSRSYTAPFLLSR